MVVTTNRGSPTGAELPDRDGLVPFGPLPLGTTTPEPPLLVYPHELPRQPLADLDEILEQRCASL